MNMQTQIVPAAAVVPSMGSQEFDTQRTCQQLMYVTCSPLLFDSDNIANDICLGDTLMQPSHV